MRISIINPPLKYLEFHLIVPNQFSGIIFSLIFCKTEIKEMKFLNELWGIKENLSPLEISERGVVMFIITLVLIRISGMRSINKSTPFDAVIAILIGGILSRGVVGATPFFSTVIGSIAILIVQKILSWLSFYNSWINQASKGGHIVLYKEGKFLEENMKKTDVTMKEIYEDLRLKCQVKTLDTIDEILMEKKGEISFIKKAKRPSGSHDQFERIPHGHPGLSSSS